MGYTPCTTPISCPFSPLTGAPLAGKSLFSVALLWRCRAIEYTTRCTTNRILFPKLVSDTANRARTATYIHTMFSTANQPCRLRPAGCVGRMWADQKARLAV
ncbi:hypothetical protein FN846DRAFT_68666 [Sphaerosporella brunnea]|uniref:Uncharacterized protein n=1 Tax=Sphaerosporella brunnea TaxID=1250544 RepID=A0A5J5ET81_9PEZI|nr:hypothetical protein FN846DRAFT_68666 [Sphaerosporella brunnea]